MNLYLGIDPGVYGGIVAIDKDLKIIEKITMPFYLKKVIRKYRGKNKTTEIKIVNTYKIKEIINDLKKLSNEIVIEKVFIEMQIPMREQGIASTANTMKSYGALIGLLIGMEIEFDLIFSRKWKEYFNLLKKDKKESIKTAQELSSDNFILPNYRTGHDGMAEAYLIARYGVLNLK